MAYPPLLEIILQGGLVNIAMHCNTQKLCEPFSVCIVFLYLFLETRVPDTTEDIFFQFKMSIRVKSQFTKDAVESLNAGFGAITLVLRYMLA